MLFLLAVFAVFLIAGIVLSDRDPIYIALGFLLGLLVVAVFMACGAEKDPISTTKHDYKLQSYIPYNDNGDCYEFFTIDENSPVDNDYISKSNVKTVLSTEREYEIKVTVEHYKKTPMLGTFMPELYGEKDIVSNVILFLPAVSR